MPSPIDYAQLDPGIRETVRWLRDVGGFNTTNSGDGVSKAGIPAYENQFTPVPHVVIECSPGELANTADRLLAACAARGLHVAPNGPAAGEPEIIASYDPVNRIAVVILSGVNDERL